MLPLGGMLCRLWRCAARGAGGQGQPAEKVRSEKSDETPSDDLTAIRGIGSAIENRLNVAGIKSYAQLARATAEDVREKLGNLGRGAKVEDWIAQARALAGKD
ncbi:MAG: hypothetical protein ACE5KF_10275 [Kiloniellaceae bacterium]